MKPIHFRGEIAYFQLVCTMSLAFSSDFDTIVEIAVLPIQMKSIYFCHDPNNYVPRGCAVPNSSGFMLDLMVTSIMIHLLK